MSIQRSIITRQEVVRRKAPQAQAGLFHFFSALLLPTDRNERFVNLLTEEKFSTYLCSCQISHILIPLSILFFLLYRFFSSPLIINYIL